MSEKYSVHYRDPLAVIKEMMGNTTFDGKMDYSPHLDYGKDSECQRCYHNFMSGNFAWNEAVGELFIWSRRGF